MHLSGHCVLGAAVGSVRSHCHFLDYLLDSLVTWEDVGPRRQRGLDLNDGFPSPVTWATGFTFLGIPFMVLALL